MVDSKIKLLSLLGSNQNKIDHIRGCKNNRELEEIYSSLTEEDSYLDSSYKTVLEVKREITLNDKTKSSLLWKIFKQEKSKELRKSSLQEFIKKSPLVLCPFLLYKIFFNASLIKYENSLHLFYLAWFLFLVASLILLPFLGFMAIPVSYVLTNILWYMTKGLTNEKFQESFAIVLLVLFLPLWILIFLFYFGVFFVFTPHHWFSLH